MRCCAMSGLPANAGDITAASKCWPSSPITLTVASGNPALIRLSISSLVMSVAQLVAGHEHAQAHRRGDQEKRGGPGEALRDRHVGGAEEAVAEAVDHVEERIGVRRGE